MDGSCKFHAWSMYINELFFALNQPQNILSDLKVTQKWALKLQSHPKCNFYTFLPKDVTFPKRHNNFLQTCTFSTLNKILTRQNLITFQTCFLYVRMERKTFKKFVSRKFLKISISCNGK